MNILLVTYYKGSLPFGDELSDHLLKKGHQVKIFDMFDMMTLTLGNNPPIDYHIRNKIIRKIFSIKVVGSFLRLIYYKCFFLTAKSKYDHIAIHYAFPFYRFFINDFKKAATGVSVTMWGSDFYRVKESTKRLLLKFYKKCDSIIIGNSVMTEEFISFYGNTLKNKIKAVGFGIGKLDNIKSVEALYSKNELKQSLGLPQDKIIVTIGYNGIKEQQHLMILQAIEKIPDQYKKRLFLLMPFGYGGDQEYLNEIDIKTKALSIDYKIINKFLSDEEIVKVRVCTDIVLNAQISDASSASIQEHLSAGNILLAGKWLPYEHFKNNGIDFWTFEGDDLTEKFLILLQNFEIYQQQVKGNADAIYKLSSWQTRIDQWIEVYSNKKPNTIGNETISN